MVAFSLLRQQMSDYLRKAAEVLPRVPDQAKAGHLQLPELLLTTVLYLGED